MIGTFDTHITIQKNQPATQDEFHEGVENWVSHCTAWAKMDYASVKESKNNDQIIGSANNVFTIHYQIGITAAMRILDGDNNIYNITGPPKVVGRNQYLIIEAEILDNQ